MTKIVYHNYDTQKPATSIIRNDSGRDDRCRPATIHITKSIFGWNEKSFYSLYKFIEISHINLRSYFTWKALHVFRN